MRLSGLFIVMMALAGLRTVAPSVAIAATQEGCTIGVASPRVTGDGRPLLWKVRDNGDLPNNSVSFDTTLPIHFIAVTNSGDAEVWMGVNAMGFAIVNATSLDLPGGSEGLTNGQLMRYALGMCSSVAEFGHLLDSTNATGRRTQANFGVMDATGATMIFETGGSAYWRFDANDPTLSRSGFVVRTNFSLTGGGSTGIERYRRTLEQIGGFVAGDSLSPHTLLRYHVRDLSDQNSQPVAVPYTHESAPALPIGYVYSNYSICRHKSVSAVVIAGVTPQEQPSLSTMWTILGQPASGIAVPYWPVGDPPEVARGESTSALHAAAVRIRDVLFDFSSYPDYVDSYKLRDECGNGLWSWIHPLEDSIIHTAEGLLDRWRLQPPTRNQVMRTENDFAVRAHSKLTESFARLKQRRVFPVANTVPFGDVNGETLRNGDVVHLVWAGEDRRINPPNMHVGDPDWGMPAGDDHLIGVAHVVGENVSSAGTFRFQMIVWSAHRMGFPAAGDLVYVRVFNGNRLESATRYGDAQLFHVSPVCNGGYVPLIPGGRTSLPLKRLFVNTTSHSSLLPNFPNPFNSSTIIEIDVATAQGPIELTIFNSLGQLVRNLLTGTFSAGRHGIEWDGTDNHGQIQPTGTYFVRFKEGPTMKVQRMLLVK